MTVTERRTRTDWAKLKTILLERLRAAAHELWGGPGDLAFERCFTPTFQSLAGPGGAERSKRAMKSNFQPVMPDFYGADIGEERQWRKEALLAQLRKDMNFESAAVRFGFGTAARLKRACLNVMGRSLRELENILAADVVMFYLTAEVKTLRNLATGKQMGQANFRARELYHNCEDEPAAPFTDLWSAAEMAKGKWLEAMAAAFG